MQARHGDHNLENNQIEGTVTVCATQWIINAMDNQRIMQSTPVIFSFRSRIADVLITVGKLRAGVRERQTCIDWHIRLVNSSI
jgi:uncharacterized protein YccT (UPF0319 family)